MTVTTLRVTLQRSVVAIVLALPAALVGHPGSVAEAAGGNWITHLATSALGYGGTDRVTAVRTGFAPRCGQRHPGWFIRVTTFPRFST